MDMRSIEPHLNGDGKRRNGGNILPTVYCTKLCFGGASQYHALGVQVQPYLAMALHRQRAVLFGGAVVSVGVQHRSTLILQEVVLHLHQIKMAHYVEESLKVQYNEVVS
jgi:hypothetical protein